MPPDTYERTTSPARHLAAITKSDSDFVGDSNGSGTRGIYVGTAGDLAVLTVGGETVTIPSVPAGAVLPICVTKVLSTGTTASGIVAMW